MRRYEIVACDHDGEWVVSRHWRRSRAWRRMDYLSAMSGFRRVSMRIVDRRGESR